MSDLVITANEAVTLVLASEPGREVALTFGTQLVLVDSPGNQWATDIIDRERAHPRPVTRR